MADASAAGTIRTGANLDPKGQNSRLRFAVVMLALGLALVVGFVRWGAAPSWRLIAFVPFFFAAFGALQGLLRICPMHSRQGTREVAGGVCLPRDDAAGQAAAKRMGRQIWTLSTVSAVFATIVVYLLPS